MNNTIEVLEKELNSCKICKADNSVQEEERQQLIKAYTHAIATLKAVESAGGLPEKRNSSNRSRDVMHHTDGFNNAIDLCQIVLAKQILKVEEAQSITAHEIEGTTEYKCEHKGTLDGDCVWCALSVAETGLDKQRAKVKELEAKIKEIENG